MNGDLVIVYDVNRDTSLGDLKVQPELISLTNIAFGKSVSISLMKLFKCQHLNKTLGIFTKMDILFYLPLSFSHNFLLISHRDQMGTLFITLLQVV